MLKIKSRFSEAVTLGTVPALERALQVRAKLRKSSSRGESVLEGVFRGQSCVKGYQEARLVVKPETLEPATWYR